MPVDDGAYDRGVAAGEIAQRLAGHDEHLAKINGSMDHVAARLAELVLAVQRPGDAMTANEATVITTAQALKEAKEASDKASDKHWTPFQRGVAAITAIAALLGAATYFLHR